MDPICRVLLVQQGARRQPREVEHQRFARRDLGAGSPWSVDQQATKDGGRHESPAEGGMAKSISHKQPPLSRTSFASVGRSPAGCAGNIDEPWGNSPCPGGSGVLGRTEALEVVVVRPRDEGRALPP